MNNELGTFLRLRQLAMVSLALLVAACGRGTEDLDAWVAEVKARKAMPIESIPQMKQYEVFTYQENSRRDPFIVPAAAPATTSQRPDMSRNKEPLEEFPLDSLRMVGTIDSKGIPYALVKAPDGVVHRVTRKNYLGQNYGEIVGISEAEISLLELIPDGFGGWVQRQASLALTQQQQ